MYPCMALVWAPASRASACGSVSDLDGRPKLPYEARHGLEVLSPVGGGTIGPIWPRRTACQ